jgi:cytochrome c553
MRRGAVLGLVVVVVLTAVASRHRAGGALAAPGVSRLNPHVAMGAHLFVQFACSACHGLQGRGGISPEVPA